MNATARFYLGFAIALLVVIGIAFFIGYRVGAAHASRTTAFHAAMLRRASSHAVPNSITPSATRAP